MSENTTQADVTFNELFQAAIDTFGADAVRRTDELQGVRLQFAVVSDATDADWDALRTFAQDAADDWVVRIDDELCHVLIGEDVSEAEFERRHRDPSSVTA